MTPKTFTDFCALVCLDIRFAPDRPAVAAELTAHLEDHRDAMMARDPELTLPKAEQAAIAAMGDPEELAQALSRVHSPVLGRIQRALGGVLVFLLLLSVLNGLWSERREALAEQFVPWRQSLLDEVKSREITILREWTPEYAVQVGDYTLRVPHAQYYSYDYDGSRALVCTLTLTCYNPWRSAPSSGWGQWLVVEDDRGGVYYGRNYSSFTTQHDFFVNTFGETLFTGYYEFFFTGIPEGVERLTLTYDRLGTSFRLPIDLTGGDAA